MVILVNVISASGNYKTLEISMIKIHNSQSNIDTENLFTPPPTPIRNVAEFEPMEGVLIRYPFGISYEIIAEMSEDVEVVTIVASASEQNYVYSQYQSHGVNVDHCSFLIAPSDTHWTRDYGPWFAITGNDELAVIDFSFYGYGNFYPNDNNIPSAFALNQGLLQYLMPLYHEGGNYMTDGQGISASTDIVWTINSGFHPNEIAQIIKDYLGVDTYHVVPDVNGGWLKHIDCWGKYLAPDLIMIREVPPGHSQYDEIEEVVDYFNGQISCFGTPYNVVRVYTPNDQPYTNSLILNDKVLVPITGSSWDDEAIESYENALPGYEVLGFTGSWYSIDALHCRTKGIPDRGMLYIEHIPISEDQTSHSGYEIEAKIIAYSGEELIPDETGVYWKVESGDWNFVEMEYLGNDYYHTYIPVQENNTKFYYYIHAEDESGRSENHPFIGAPMAYSFTGLFINDIPENPSINGPLEVDVNKEIEYIINASDSDSDDVYYFIDWGDGTSTEWDGPYESNEEVNYQHTWTTAETFTLKVKAKDIYDAESEWSELDRIVPRTRLRDNNLINGFFNRFINLFSILELLIQQFVK